MIKEFNYYVKVTSFFNNDVWNDIIIDGLTNHDKFKTASTSTFDKIGRDTINTYDIPKYLHVPVLCAIMSRLIVKNRNHTKNLYVFMNRQLHL